MAEKAFKPKLSAIPSADAVGYSKLMRDDEDMIIRTFTTYRSAITSLVEKFRAHMMAASCDNLLEAFSSIVDAVDCGIEIHRELAERNAELPDDRKMEFRIEVNMDDIVKKEGRIYIDGVNIPTGMANFAKSGAVCIAGRLHDSVKSILALV